MDKLLDIDELSELINVKKSSIFDLVYRKKIPYVKVGNRLRFRIDLIEAWLQQKTFIPHGMIGQGKI
jgi:excisionase family DNA binding protein